MLAEAFQFLTTPCSAVSRKLGYLKEAIALEARYRRCGNSWTPHLDNTRHLICEAIDACPRQNKVVVLGSGLLLDIPIDTLSAQFERVDLIGMIHLRSARRLIKSFRNIELLEVDITGVGQALVAQNDPNTEHSWPAPFRDTNLFEGADLVVSANILSQLPLSPGDYLMRSGHQDVAAIRVFKRKIIDHHLQFLDRLSCTVCFIADVDRQIFTESARIETEDLLLGAEPLIETYTWMWDVAPAPEIDRHYRIRHRVVGGIRPARER